MAITSLLAEAYMKYQKALNAAKEQYIAAFLAETGLEPSECVMVERREGMQTSWTLEKKEAE